MQTVGNTTPLASARCVNTFQFVKVIHQLFPQIKVIKLISLTDCGARLSTRLSSRVPIRRATDFWRKPRDVCVTGVQRGPRASVPGWKLSSERDRAQRRHSQLLNYTHAGFLLHWTFVLFPVQPTPNRYIGEVCKQSWLFRELFFMDLVSSYPVPGAQSWKLRLQASPLICRFLCKFLGGKRRDEVHSHDVRSLLARPCGHVSWRFWKAEAPGLITRDLLREIINVSWVIQFIAVALCEKWPEREQSGDTCVFLFLLFDFGLLCKARSSRVHGVFALQRNQTIQQARCNSPVYQTTCDGRAIKSKT